MLFVRILCHLHWHLLSFSRTTIVIQGILSCFGLIHGLWILQGAHRLGRKEVASVFVAGRLLGKQLVGPKLVLQPLDLVVIVFNILADAQLLLVVSPHLQLVLRRLGVVDLLEPHFNFFLKISAQFSKSVL